MNVIGQNFALELLPLAIAKQGIQFGWRLDRRRHAFPQGSTTVSRRLQGKPVISMGTERDDIARFSDRPKQIAAKNFHRNAPGKAREIQLCRLRKARKIYHHHDRLVFPPAEKRQHFRIVWVKKFKGAARERLEIFSHGDDPAHPPQQ